jgi:methionyl-tRNA formyltransferase
MSTIGADLIAESLLQFDRGEISPSPQEEKGVSYAPILKKEDGRIDWGQTSQQIYNRMRGFVPWPGSYSTFRERTCHLWGHPDASGAAGAHVAPGEIVSSLKEIHIVCGEGTRLRLESIQVDGRKKISAREFANGARLAPSERFA